jgi:DNA-directed RNA polymerase specialized sigma24 family protein
VAPPVRPDEIVALDEALEGLGQMDSRRSRVVELRFFEALSVEETAEVLQVSHAHCQARLGRWPVPGYYRELRRGDDDRP